MGGGGGREGGDGMDVMRLAKGLTLMAWLHYPGKEGSWQEDTSQNTFLSETTAFYHATHLYMRGGGGVKTIMPWRLHHTLPPRTSRYN